MSHLPIAITAYLLNGTAVLIDKFLLTKKIPDPLIYIFYFSAFSCLVLLVLPFTSIPNSQTFLLSSFSTLLWTSGAYFMFKGLQIGQPSRVIPVIGSLVPTFLFLYYALIHQSFTSGQILAVGFLISGLVALALPYFGGKLIFKEFVFEIISALLFAISYIVLKEAYNLDSFITVFVWSRIILIPVGIIILLVPNLRHIVFSSNGPRLNLRSKAGVLFLFGQAAGGASELLLTFSISLANPALVNSLQGTQYAFIFLASIILSKHIPQVYKEQLSTLTLASKVIGILLVAVGLYILAFNQ